MLKTQYYEETISDVISRIDSNDIFLPALQRKFVWDTDQIEKLFDSIMQGFPSSIALSVSSLSVGMCDLTQESSTSVCRGSYKIWAVLISPLAHI